MAIKDLKHNAVQKIVILCGPTAVGKSALALELAEKWNAEIVSADSQQIWRELDIGTAKPSPQDRARVPHHLIDVANPDEHFDVSRYAALADAAIADICGRGRMPLVVGGAGMYIRILLYGLCEAPPQDSAVRKQLMDRIQREGCERLYEELKKTDSVAAQKIHPNDTTRVVRALEVHAVTGQTLSQFQKAHAFRKPRYEALQIGLTAPRATLHEKIEQRVNWMIANGWGEEVRELLKFYSPECQALQSIGYKQLVAHLQGRIPLEDAVEVIKQQTRAFARRQLTWFRADKKIRWFDTSQKSDIEKLLHGQNS